MTLMSLSIKWIRLAFIACELLCLKFCVTGSHVCSTNSNLLTVEKLSAPDLILRKSGREGIIIECNAPIENLLIPVESCYVPSDHRSTGVVSVSSHPHAFPSSLYLMLQIATLWNANPASSQQSELIFEFQTVYLSTRSKDRYVVDISHSVQKTYTNRIDTFHIPVYPQWKIRSGGVYVRKFSSNAVYLFYAAVHMVPPIHDVERNRYPNLLDPYFLALGQPGASEDPKSVLQDLLDPDTLDSGSVELIADADGKRHFQFGTHGTNTTTRMSVNNLKSLVTSNSRDANVLNVNLDAVAFFPEIDEHVHLDFSVCISLHATVTTAAQFCLHLAQIHFSTHARLTQRIFNGTVDSTFNQYPVALRAPWTDTTKALERIVVTFKYSGPDNIRIILRPLSIYVVQDQEQISDVSRDHRTFPVANQEPAMGRTWSTVNDSITKYPKAHRHALGAPSISDTTPGQVSPAGGSTVPAPDPHDTRDPTVSPVQPRSRGMGSLRAVVGALGAGRRSTSVVAAAVVRRGMPRTGRAGAWGTGRAALLVLGVVCGVALLLAAVVLVLVRMRRNSKNQIEPVSPSDGSNSLRKAFLDNKRSEVMNVYEKQSINSMIDVGWNDVDAN